MHNPDQCEQIRTCSIHEQCYIGERISGLSGSRIWTSRCGHETVDCQVPVVPVDSVVGKRQSSICHKCCKDNLCNNNCASPVKKPVIIYVTRPRDVSKGAYLHLTCRASGNPTPIISWSFLSISNTLPTNVKVSNHGADILINQVTDQNYGDYACKAQNSQGEDVRYIQVLEHGPNGQ
ncbi:palladin-like [Ylistrum balloti]|uniref:palladin-like n=1 Tax=Ylistrum balloti TaxID=509963 RepID=UPI002905A589|nr:palladin-like [Ylistrum balloti]